MGRIFCVCVCLLFFFFINNKLFSTIESLYCLLRYVRKCISLSEKEISDAFYLSFHNEHNETKFFFSFFNARSSFRILFVFHFYFAALMGHSNERLKIARFDVFPLALFLFPAEPGGIQLRINLLFLFFSEISSISLFFDRSFFRFTRLLPV